MRGDAAFRGIRGQSIADVAAAGRVYAGWVILRDPVHGLISFTGDAERLVHGLLGTREVQRLRRIRALGLASYNEGKLFSGARTKACDM